jgi:hypothetical protein
MNVVVVVEGDVFGGKVGKSGVGLRFSRWISAKTRGGQAYGLCTILHKLSTFFDKERLRGLSWKKSPLRIPKELLLPKTVVFGRIFLFFSFKVRDS